MAPRSALLLPAGSLPPSSHTCLLLACRVSPLLRFTSPDSTPTPSSLLLRTFACPWHPLSWGAVSSQPVLGLTPLFFIPAQTGPPLSATSASWMPSPRKQNPQKGWEDPLPTLRPSPVRNSSSRKKKGAWMSGVMVVAKWWGGGRTDSGRQCACGGAGTGACCFIPVPPPCPP